MGFGLNVSCHRHRHHLPLEASILFLVLAIATGGVNLVAQGAASISGGWCGLCCWVCFDSGLLDFVDCVDSELLGLFFWFARFVTGGLCGFRCDTGVGCWVCFSGLLGLLLVDCVDSGVIPVWVARFVFLVCWVCCRWIVWIQV